MNCIEPLPGAVYLVWKIVSSKKEKISQNVWVLTMSLNIGPKILLSYFFFSNMIIYFLKHNVSACHIFLYKLEWFANHDNSCSCKIWWYHHLMCNFIINSCVHFFFSLVPTVHFVSAIFVSKDIRLICKHLAVIYFTRILICIKLTQPELVCYFYVLFG